MGSLRTPVTLSAGPLGYPFVPFALYSLLGALLHVLVWQYGLWKFGALLLVEARRAETDLLGLALAAMEKSVQLVYEQQLRPEDKRHLPWQERVASQLTAAYSALEQTMAKLPPDINNMDQAGISIAVAWRFSRELLPQQLDWMDFPLLQQWSTQAEALPAFVATPFE